MTTLSTDAGTALFNSAISSIAAAATSSASDNYVDFGSATKCGLSITLTITTGATASPVAQIYCYGSKDHTTYDTDPCWSSDVQLVAANTTRTQSFIVQCPMRYFNVKVKNNDAAQTITSVQVTAQVQTLA